MPLDIGLNAVVATADSAALAMGWQPIWKTGWRPTEFGYMNKYVRKQPDQIDTFVHLFVHIGGSRDHLVRLIAREYKYVGSNEGGSLVRLPIGGRELVEYLKKQKNVTLERVTLFFESFGNQPPVEDPKPAK